MTVKDFMVRVDWLRIVQDKEDAILQTLEKLYAEAADGVGVYTAEINIHGHISTYQEPSENTYSEDLFHGRAITLAKWPAFRCQDGDEFEHFPADRYYLTEAEHAAFLTWAEAEGYDDEEITPALIREWNPTVADRWDEEYRRDHVSAFAENTARNAYDALLRELELRA